MANAEPGSANADLFRAILTLETVEECEAFFRDLCTLGELRALGERWNVVLKLKEGLPYRTISEHTGVSTATITRVAHWLQHGRGGYDRALERLGDD